MAARSADATLGVTVSVEAFVALRVTVAWFDVRPACAWAVLETARARAAAPAKARIRGRCIESLRGVRCGGATVSDGGVGVYKTCASGKAT